MQVEVISALIGAAVAIPTAGVAYAVGRHQATATISAVRTQVQGNRRQWRDDSRRSAWLDFMRSGDAMDSAIGAALRSETARTPISQDLIEDFWEKLALVEFEGPTEIYELARRFHRNIVARLAIVTIVGPFLTTQARFDSALAEARQALALSSSPSDQATRVLEAHDALQALAAERATIRVAALPSDAMGLAEAIFAPIVQRVESIHHETGEAIAMITQGLSSVMVSIISATPSIAINATRKVQQCEDFNEGDAAALMFNYGSGSLTLFQAEIDRISNVVRNARDEFLKETDKHLDGRLPVVRSER